MMNNILTYVRSLDHVHIEKGLLKPGDIILRESIIDSMKLR